MAATSIETRTLAEQIAARVRDDVLSGALAAGARLSQEALAEQYAVSRVPVRDALRMLEAEGFVSAHPRFGTAVAPLSTPDLEELYEARLALEPMLSARAVRRMRPADLAEMRRQLDVMAASSEDSPAWFAAHAGFHRVLNERSGRARICALVDNLRSLTERYVRAYQVLAWPDTELQAAHEQLLGAVERGDPDEVEALVADHLTIVRDRMFEHLEGGEEAR